jgi:hypothetical protein
MQWQALDQALIAKVGQFMVGDVSAHRLRVEQARCAQRLRVLGQEMLQRTGAGLVSTDVQHFHHRNGAVNAQLYPAASAAFAAA